MENIVSAPLSLDNQPGTAVGTEEINASLENGTGEISALLENGNGSTFVNQAAITWHENRKQWIGDETKKSRKSPKESIINWCMTYEDLLSTNQNFSEPIPLAEMVDFLVDIWYEEGLFD